MRPECNIPITWEEADELKNEGERNFAIACLEVGCEVYYQVSVGDSNIDFLIINPKANTEGKLVEITYEKREDIYKKFVYKGKGKHRKKVLNTTGIRKQRQIENMKNSGQKWTILFDEETKKLNRY